MPLVADLDKDHEDSVGAVAGSSMYLSRLVAPFAWALALVRPTFATTLPLRTAVVG